MQLEILMCHSLAELSIGVIVSCMPSASRLVRDWHTKIHSKSTSTNLGPLSGSNASGRVSNFSSKSPLYVNFSKPYSAQASGDLLERTTDKDQDSDKVPAVPQLAHQVAPVEGIQTTVRASGYKLGLKMEDGICLQSEIMQEREYLTPPREAKNPFD